MALQDIINTLTAEAEAEIAAIALERDTEVAHITAQLESYTNERTTAAATDRARRAEKIAERILAKARHQAAFIATGGAQQAVEVVFAEIEQLLRTLPEADYQAFLAAQWHALPTLTGTIRFKVAEERLDTTRTFLLSQGVAESAITPVTGLYGGFVVETDTHEVDCSFAGILRTTRLTDTVHISQQLTQ